MIAIQGRRITIERNWQQSITTSQWRAGMHVSGIQHLPTRHSIFRSLFELRSRPRRRALGVSRLASDNLSKANFDKIRMIIGMQNHLALGKQHEQRTLRHP